MGISKKMSKALEKAQQKQDEATRKIVDSYYKRVGHSDEWKEIYEQHQRRG